MDQLEAPPENHYIDNGRLMPGQNEVEAAVRTILRFIDPEPDRTGLIETPTRVYKAFREMTAGYREDPKEILSKQFDQDEQYAYDEIILLRDIPFSSYCEHHLLEFSGTMSVAYLPKEGGKVVGLSKLARLVDCFAKRLQMQERLTKQVASSLYEMLEARGAAAVCRSAHSCMRCRGVKKSGATMITNVLLGMFRTDAATRNEFLQLCRM